MEKVKLTCNYCGATAEGYRKDLEMIGWVSKAIMDKGKMTTKTGCPSHHTFVKNK
jgi:hypothetical protein